jgi:hypothetical protein
MTRSEVVLRAAKIAGWVECYLQRNARTDCSMTDATEAIWGTSGRGNPNAVKQIEAAAYVGFLRITQQGRTRRVCRTTAPIPEEAFPAADREWAMKF